MVDWLNGWTRAICLAAAVLAATSASHPLQAATLLAENFDAEGPGGSVANFNGFTQFSVPAAQGTVDLVQSPGSGLVCFGGAGRCVELGGSSRNPGVMASNTLFSWSAGDRLTLFMQISGNQRNSANDAWFAGFNGPSNFSWTSVILNRGCGTQAGANGSGTLLTMSAGGACLTDGNDPFALRTLSFTAGSAGSGRIVIGDPGGPGSDDIGVILDNVRLDIATAVPEPSGWAMMIAGFGLIGAAMRRRGSALRPGVA